MVKKAGEAEVLRCSFCNKDQNDVRKLIAPPAAVRAALEKEGDLSRMIEGLRREKSVDFVMSRVTITNE